MKTTKTKPCLSCGIPVPDKKTRKWCYPCYVVQANQRALARYYAIKHGEVVPRHRAAKTNTVAGMRQYQRQYYKDHREKALEYAQQYKRRVLDKARKSEKQKPFPPDQRIPKTVVSASDIMRSPNLEKMLNRILRGALHIAKS